MWPVTERVFEWVWSPTEVSVCECAGMSSLPPECRPLRSGLYDALDSPRTNELRKSGSVWPSSGDSESFTTEPSQSFQDVGRVVGSPKNMRMPPTGADEVGAWPAFRAARL